MILAGDIGGTNTRLACFERRRAPRRRHRRGISCLDRRGGGSFGSTTGRNSVQRPRAETPEFLGTLMKIHGRTLH